MTQKSLGKTPSRQINPALHSTLQTTLDPATPTQPLSTLPHLLCRTYCNQAYTRPCHTYPVVPTLSRLPHLSRLARLG